MAESTGSSAAVARSGADETAFEPSAKEETSCCNLRPRAACYVIAGTLICLDLVALVREAAVETLSTPHQLPDRAPIINYRAIVVICFTSVSIICNFLLIGGVIRGMRSLVLVWLIYHAIMFSASVLAYGYWFVVECTVDYSDGLFAMLVLFIGLLHMAVYWYWFIVVASYHRHQMKQ